MKMQNMKKILPIIIIAFLCSCEQGHFTGREENICVENKEIMIVNSKSGTKREKMIFTEDEVYSVKNCFIAEKSFKSLTVYNNLKDGKCYKVLTNNSRIGLLSMKRNICKIIEEVK
jgi:hypothetical protein